MHSLLKRLRDMGLLPLVMPSATCDATVYPDALAQALLDAPLPLLALPFRNVADEDALRRLSTAHPGLLLGATGVTSLHQAARAKAAGAQFLLTTGFNSKVVSWCVEHELLILPGCATASDVEEALGMGLAAVTFYPADGVGGPATLRALHAAYPTMAFVPAGCLDAAAVADYLDCPAVLACATTRCADEALVVAGDFAGITRYAREAVHAMLDMRVGHVGVYPEAESQAATQALVDEFALITGDAVTDIGPGVFVGGGIEVLKITSDWKGHIDYDVLCVDRACAHLALRGVMVDESTARYNAAGYRYFIYLAKPVGQFGVHLRNRKQ